jgi:hypothetical protein
MRAGIEQRLAKQLIDKRKLETEIEKLKAEIKELKKEHVEAEEK